jgi:hypothetical protein
MLHPHQTIDLIRITDEDLAKWGGALPSHEEIVEGINRLVGDDAEVSLKWVQLHADPAEPSLRATVTFQLRWEDDCKAFVL